MGTRTKIHAAVCVVALVAAAMSAADPSVDALIKEILSGAKTDAERAAKLYEAAKLTGTDKKIQAELLQRAVEYGLRSVSSPVGREAAERSLDLLVEAAPDRKDEWTRKKVELFRRALKRMPGRTLRKKAVTGKLVALLLQAGAACEQEAKWREAAALYREARFPAHTMNLSVKDEVSRRFARATHFMMAQRRAAARLRALKKDTQDVAARVALIEALVIQLNDPAEASKHLTDDVDEQWRTYVRLAAKPTAELQAAASKELGDWYYRVLLKKATSYSRDPVLYRARAYYERFLKASPKGSPRDLRVELAITQIKNELYKREAYKRWINLLKYVDENTTLTRGKWRPTVDGPRVYAPLQASAVVPVPVTPQGNYEIEVTFIRHAWGKADSVLIACPVGTAGRVHVILDGYAKHIAGFENIRGPGGTAADENGTAVSCRVPNGREYPVHVTVEVQKKNAKIVVKLRGSKLMEWSGPLSDIVSGYRAPRTFGLGAGWNTSITYTSAKLRMLTGKAKLPP